MFLKAIGYLIRLTNRFLDDWHPVPRRLFYLGFKRMRWIERCQYNILSDDMTLAGLFTVTTPERDIRVNMAVYADHRSFRKPTRFEDVQYQLLWTFRSMKDNKLLPYSALSPVIAQSQLDQAINEGMVTHMLAHQAVLKARTNPWSKESTPILHE